MNRRIRMALLALSLMLVIGMLAWLTHALLKQSEETERSERRINRETLAHEAQMNIDRELAAFITFEQARGYFEYLPVYAYQRPYDLRIDPPLPDEAGRNSVLAAYLPACVSAYILISPEGKVSGPALSEEEASRLNAISDLYKRLDAKISAMVAMPSTGDLWLDIRNQILHDVPPPEQCGEGSQAQVEGVSSFVPLEDKGAFYILRQVYTNRGVWIQGALMDMNYLNQLLPAHVKQYLPQCRIDVFDPFLRAQQKSRTLSEEEGGTENEDSAHRDALYFFGFPLVFQPGSGEAIPARNHKKVLNWTLILIWSMVLLGAVGVVWLSLGSLRLEQRKSDFVSAVTHELRTPLTTFSLCTEMLEDGMVPEQKKPEYYARMQRECRRLEHLIDNVLAYSKLQRNAIRNAKDTLTCQELFEPIAEKIERRLREADIAFSFVLAQPIRILPIRTNAVAIEQIMDNLTSNAIKYAKGEHAQVRLTVQADRRNIVARFKDNGPGISPRNSKLVFQPFRRTKEATASRKPGVGLGLSLARETARSLGGDLKLELGSLGGASFLLTIPKS